MQVLCPLTEGNLRMSFILEIKVVPQSGKFGFICTQKGELKCMVKAQPEKGAANKELIKGLAQLLNVTQNDIEIVSGLTSRKKRIKIHKTFTREQLYKALGIALQGVFVDSDFNDSCSIG